jgi:hypothetical protein
MFFDAVRNIQVIKLIKIKFISFNAIDNFSFDFYGKGLELFLDVNDNK